MEWIFGEISYGAINYWYIFIMKKTYPTSDKAKEWAKHLKPYGKRLANKSTRRLLDEQIKKQLDGAEQLNYSKPMSKDILDSRKLEERLNELQLEFTNWLNEMEDEEKSLIADSFCLTSDKMTEEDWLEAWEGTSDGEEWKNIVSMQPTMYARKEPSTDEILKQYAPNAKKFDIVIYSDAQAQRQKCVFSWYLSNKPTRRNKYVMFNCFRYRLEWI